MVKTLFGFLLCALCLWIASAGMAIPNAYLPALSAAAQDSAGTVWAVPVNNGGDDSNADKVYCWQAGTWAAQTVPGASGFRPLALTRGDDGAVYVLWQKWDQYQAAAPTQCLVTVHQGAASRLLLRLSDPILPVSPFPVVPALWAGAGGDLWIAADSSQLWHVPASGTAQSFATKPDQRFDAAQPGFSTSFSSLTDGMGRRWFWQSGQNNWVPGHLRGFLIWDGKTLASQAALPGLPDRTFTGVTRLDRDHLWVAVSRYSFPWGPNPKGGLYQVDMRTLNAVPVTPLAGEAFDLIDEVFRVNGDWWVLEERLEQQPHLEQQPRFRLWHRLGLSWHKEPAALAVNEHNAGSYDFGNGEAAPPFLETLQGTWRGRNGAGLVWMPRSGTQVISVDWRRGVTAGRVSDLFRLPGGKILAFSRFGQGDCVVPPLPPPPLPARPGVSIGGPGQPSTMGDMLADPRRHLWGLKYAGGLPVLDEWDGRQWHDHPLPKIKSSIQGAGLYACDTQGRIWLTFQIWNPPAQPQPVDGRLVYDPAYDHWAQYGTVPEALAAAAQPGMAFLPYRGAYPKVLFSSDGHVAYVDSQTLFLYDGKWRHWKNHDIQPSYPYGNEPDNPRFNKNGHLEITLDTHAYEWTSDGWQPNGPAVPASAAPPLPPGGPQGFWGQPIKDNLGGEWIVWDGDVYLTRHGLWRKQTVLSGPGSPFFDTRSLQNVLQDTQGRMFFETTDGGAYEYVVWTPPAAALPPAPRIQLTPLSADSVRLRFAAKMTGPRWFQWRFNGGAWSDPTPTDTVTLTALTPGNYRVEAQAINTLLQASPTPSAAIFVLQPPTTAQMAHWVRALLSGTDDEREAAVAGLVKQPEAARAALGAARSGASESGRWWIDAALQQITEQAAASELL